MKVSAFAGFLRHVKVKYPSAHLRGGRWLPLIQGSRILVAFLPVLSLFFASFFPSVAADRTPPVEVPFLFQGDQIIVEARVNGRSLRMMLDTGADVCIFNRAIASQIGLKFSRRPVSLRGVGMGKAQAFTTKIPLLEIGQVSGRDLLSLITETTPKVGDKAVDGIIGFEFLKDKIFQIDYAGEKLRFYESAPFRKPDAQSGRRAVLPFRLREKRDMPILDDVRINGKPVSIGIDTGSDSGLVLFPGAVQALGLEEEAKKLKSKVSFGYGGVALTRLGRVQEFSIGSFSLESTEAEFALSAWGGREGGQFGNKILKNFVVTFDYQNRLVTFEK